MTTPLFDDRYLLLGKLGRGGMASVYRAFDRVRQAIVAIKVHTEKAQAGPAHPLAGEFAIWSRLRHPNIVRARELGIVRSGPWLRGSPYLVLEHARGRPADRSLVPGAVGSRALACFATQALRGLAEVHGAGLIHRDVKPSNLLTDVVDARVKRVKLTDFGLASRCGAAEYPGRISGSLPYVAPEVLLGHPLDGRSDLYSLGVALFQLATGKLPVKRDIHAILSWHLCGAPADPLPHRPSLSPRLVRLIRSLTARDPECRPFDAPEALRLLGVPGETGKGGRSASEGNAVRDRLRLALDATRLGSRRRFRLPSSRSLVRELLREVRVWCQTRGIGFHPIRTENGVDGLSETILHMLVDRGGHAARLTKRYRLQRWLPVGLLGGFPVRDESGDQVSFASGNGNRNGKAAAEIVRFLLACATERPMVLSVEREAPHDPLAHAVLASLRTLLDSPTPPRPGRGGLLLLEACSSRMDPG